MLLALCEGIPAITGTDYPHKCPVTRSIDVLFDVHREQTFQQIVELQVIWDSMELMWRRFNEMIWQGTLQSRWWTHISTEPFRCWFMYRNFNNTKQWCNNEHDGVSNHRRLDCLLNCLFRRRSKRTSKLRVTGLCKGNPPVTRGFPSQRASNAQNVFISWRRHEICICILTLRRYHRVIGKKYKNLVNPSQIIPFWTHNALKRVLKCLESVGPKNL